MTDQQITSGQLSHKRRTVAILLAASGGLTLTKLVAPGWRWWLAVACVATIGYAVYIATVVQVWNAHYRIEQEKQRRKLYPSLYVTNTASSKDGKKIDFTLKENS